MKSGKKIDWKRVHDITIDEVKATKGLENLSDDQAQEIIDLIKIYCRCIYSIYERGKNGEIDLDAIILDTNNNQQHKRAA
jgi:hypothetical protein